MRVIQQKSDYGVLSDVSKSANYLLGDRSGRSISMRTAHGFRDSLNLDVSDKTAEDIVHAGMAATGLMLTSKNEAAIAGGFLLLAGLFGCYQAGR